MKKKYYVYEWFDIETNIIFYVGKGTGHRMYNTSGRNKYFKRYIKTHKCDVRKIKEFDLETEALEYEKIHIAELKKEQMCFCNFDEGGRNGGRAFGECNGMYHKTHSAEVRQRLSTINSDGRHKGENNSQYGISPKQRMGEEVYQRWKEKHRRFGKSNSQYGVSPKERMSPEKYEIWLKSQNKGEKGNNPNAKAVKMFNEYNSLIFSSIIECAEYIQQNLCKKIVKLNSIQNNISTAIHKSTMYHTYYFQFI